MKKKCIIIGVLLVVLVIGAVLFMILRPESALRSITTEKTELSGEITSFYIAKPNLVIESRDLEQILLYNTPANRSQEDMLWAEASLVEELGERQTWIIPIPEPELIRKIYVTGIHQETETERSVYPIAGLVEMYEALWGVSPAATFSVHVGESFVVGDTTYVVQQVLEDSRCPIGATCVQSGRVVVELLVQSESEEVVQYIVSTNEEAIQIADQYIQIQTLAPEATEGDSSSGMYEFHVSIITNVLSQ